MLARFKKRYSNATKLLGLGSALAICTQLMACSTTQMKSHEHSLTIDHSHLPEALIAQPLEEDKEFSSTNGQEGAPSVLIIIEDDLHFEPGSYRLSARSKKLLTKLAGDLALESGLDVKEIELNGYTDAVGSDASNLILAQRRIDAVKTFLTALINRELKWKTRAYGENYPLALSGASANQYKNRRVELLVKAKIKLEQL